MNKNKSILTECEKTIEKELILNPDPILPSLLTGKGGVALFYAYYYLETNDSCFLKKCQSIIDDILIQVEKEPILFTFCDGLSGIGWLIQHLIDIGIIDSEKYNLSDFDKYIKSYCLHEFKNGNYDFLHGGIGAGIYFINRPLKYSRKHLDNIINILYDTATFDRKGIYWLDNYSVLYDEKDKRPRVNFGISHGITSIVYFLTKVLELDISKQKAEILLRGSIEFLMSNRNKNESSFFPNFYFIDNNLSGVSRLGWCYGDLSILNSLFLASKVLNDNDLFCETKKMALVNSRRIEYKETLLIDGGICHGYAGVSLAFKKFYDFTNENVFLETSHYWYDQLIIEINKSGGPEHFRTYFPKEKKFVESFDLITGLTGAAFLIMMFHKTDISGLEKCFLIK